MKHCPNPSNYEITCANKKQSVAMKHCPNLSNYKITDKKKSGTMKRCPKPSNYEITDKFTVPGLLRACLLHSFSVKRTVQL